MFLKLGKSEFAANRFALAIRHFRTALNINPKSTGAMNGLAACYDKLGRFDIAAYFYQSALKQTPHSATTLNNIGYSYYLQKKFDLAAVYLKEAGNHDKANNSLIRANLRIVDMMLRKHAERPTRRASRRAISVDRESASPASAPRETNRLVRSGRASFTLFTGPTQISEQSAVRDGSSGDRVPTAGPPSPRNRRELTPRRHRNTQMPRYQRPPSSSWPTEGDAG